MTKGELVAAVAVETHTTQAETEKYVKAVFDVIEKAMAKGDDVKLPGFGSFEVRERAARKGRNPQTGEEMEIPAGKQVGFKAGKSLKDAVNGK